MSSVWGYTSRKWGHKMGLHLWEWQPVSTLGKTPGSRSPLHPCCSHPRGPAAAGRCPPA